MKRFSSLYLLLLFASFLSFSNLQAQSKEGARSSLDLIRQAYLAGELDEETSLVYKVWAALDPHRLPPEFSRQPVKFQKSLTPLFLEVRARWEGLSEKAKTMLLPYLQRPTEPGQEPPIYGHSYSVPAVFHDSPGGHFRVWYVTSSQDSPAPIFTHGDTIPDWIHLCAQVLDHVWEVAVDTLGYRQPPADGPWYGLEDFGGDSRYDVYVENLDAHRIYGYTQSEYFVTGSVAHAATSYLVIDNDYSSSIYPTRGEAGLKVTAAHEFFHAIQFAYDTLEDRFLMEISSTWMEDVVYDQINDYYYYLSPPGYSTIFSRPELSLITFDGLHEYSSCVWAHYLDKRFGREMIRDIWEGCIERTAMQAMEESLKERGSDLASAHNEFAVWNYYTGSRADTVSYYPEGDRYPQVQVYADNLHSVYPVDVNSVSHPPETLGANYIRFLTQDIPGGLNVELKGRPDVLWRAALLGLGPPHKLIQIAVDGFGQGQAQMADWSSYAEVVLVVTPFAATGSGLQYAYRGERDSSLTEPLQVITQLGQSYPNPVVGDRVVIPFSIAQGGQVTLRILTLAGELVREFQWGYVQPGSYYGPNKGTNDWDLKNDAGEPVAAGVYLCHLQAGDFTEIRKMIVVR